MNMDALDAQGLRLGDRRCKKMSGTTPCRREQHADERHEFYQLRENCPHGFYNCKRCGWKEGLPNARPTAIQKGGDR